MRTREEILADGGMLFAFLSETEECSKQADFVLAMGGSDLQVEIGRASWRERV